jgi:DUF1707 SHOCT-like domain
MSGAVDRNPAAMAGRGHVRASHADREQVIDTLSVAFAQGRLAKDEFDARIGRGLVARTYADLAAVVAGLPAGPVIAEQPRQPSKRMSNAARWAAAGLVTPVIIGAALAAGALGGGVGYAVLGFVVAFAYFVCWLSAGTEMLWQWHCLSVPAARSCARCAHTAGSHRRRASCAVRAGSLNVWGRCACAGYVPPGVSPSRRPRARAAHAVY